MLYDKNERMDVRFKTFRGACIELDIAKKKFIREFLKTELFCKLMTLIDKIY